jgi:hypothetical protein
MKIGKRTFAFGETVRLRIPGIQMMIKTGMMNRVHRVTIDALRRNW